MRKLNVTILVGILVAVLGAGLVFAYGRNVDDKVADGKQVQKVLVATQAIPAGVSADQIGGAIKVEEIPTAYLPEGVLTDMSQVAGLFALGPIGSGTQLTTASFGTQAQAASVGGVGSVTPSKGKIAVAVQTELTPGVARYVQPGSSVDLFVTYNTVGNESTGGQATGGQATTAERTKLFVSGVKVLSVEAAQVSQDDGDDSTADAGALVDGVLTVLDLTPSDAELVVNATTNGSIYMGLSALSGNATVHRTPTGASANDVLSNNR